VRRSIQVESGIGYIVGSIDCNITPLPVYCFDRQAIWERLARLVQGPPLRSGAHRTPGKHPHPNAGAANVESDAVKRHV